MDSYGKEQWRFFVSIFTIQCPWLEELMIRQNFCLKRKSKAFEILYSLQTMSDKRCKNDERNVPDLILLGAQNTSYFVLMVHGWNILSVMVTWTIQILRLSFKWEGIGEMKDILHIVLYKIAMRLIMFILNPFLSLRKLYFMSSSWNLNWGWKSPTFFKVENNQNK